MWLNVIVYFKILIYVYSQIEFDLKPIKIRSSSDSNLEGSNLDVVPLNNKEFYGSEYYTEIMIGSPPSLFRVVLDTGSADLWVPSLPCAGTCLQNKNYYNSNLSLTYKNESTNDFDYLLLYGGGYCQGLLISDVVFFGDLIAIGQDFLAATDISMYKYKIQGYDGVLGIGFQKLSVTGALPLTYTLANQSQIESNKFSFYFTKNEDGIGSKFILGHSYNQYFLGELNYHQVILVESEGYFLLSGKKVGFGNLNADFNIVMIDTGNSQINIDKRLNVTIPQIKDCADNELLPDLIVEIDDTEYRIESSFYIFKNGTVCENLITLSDPFFPNHLDRKLVLLGIPFLKKYYSEFDIDNQVVGLALNL